MSYRISLRACVVTLFSSIFLAFGLRHVHSLSGVTEGGVLGLTLLLQYCFSVSPAVSGFILNLLSYLVGWKYLGKKFIFYSMIATVGFSVSYKIFEMCPPIWPQLADMPLVASIVGALFVGIGAGFCVRMGGAPSGDDALAMSISHVTHIPIQWIYLADDLVVLVLSLVYIPWQKIGYSLLTVILSGQIIGFIKRARFSHRSD